MRVRACVGVCVCDLWTQGEPCLLSTKSFKGVLTVMDFRGAQYPLT